MSDLQILFLVLACLYAWECACWLKRGSIGFVKWLGHRWRMVASGSLLAGNQDGGFIIAPPLPPLGCIVSAAPPPLSLSAEAVLAYTSFKISPGWTPFQTAKSFRFAEIKTISAKGKKIFINDELLLKTATATLAQFLAARLRELKDLPAEQRASAIETLLRGTLDTEAIQTRWRDFKDRTRRLRWLTNTLFAYLFLIAPLVIWFSGLKLSWPGLLLGLLALTASITILFFRAHKALFPAAEDERFTHCILTCLSPVTAIRAQDTLSRPLLETFHPLAIAGVLGTAEQFRQLSRRVVVDLRFPALPVCPIDEPAAKSAALFTRRFLERELELFLESKQIKAGELIQPPARTDETCASYCPRCQAQFTAREGDCPDCNGVRLVTFPSGATG